jgi:hypothetical protein
MRSPLHYVGQIFRDEHVSSVMGIINKLKSIFAQQQEPSPQYLAEPTAGNDNGPGLFNNKRLFGDNLTQAVDVLNNVSNVLESGVGEVLANSMRDQKLFQERMGRIIAHLEDMTNVLTSRLDGIVNGVNIHAKLFDSKFDALIDGFNDQTHLINKKLDTLIEMQRDEASPINRRPTPH